MNDYSEQLRQIATGHALLAACAALYLIWWCVFFRPRAQSPQGIEYVLGVAFILGAVAFGAIAVAKTVQAVGALPSAIPGFAVVVVAVALYVVLLIATTTIFNRPVTTELLLIVAWLALEAFVLSALVTTGMPAGMVALCALLVVAAFVASMVCYVLYYKLSGTAAFLDGCGPLVAVGILSTLFALILRLQ